MFFSWRLGCHAFAKHGACYEMFFVIQAKALFRYLANIAFSITNCNPILLHAFSHARETHAISHMFDILLTCGVGFSVVMLITSNILGYAVSTFLHNQTAYPHAR
jgi:hypothetical protein